MKDALHHPQFGIGRSPLGDRNVQTLLRSRDELKVLIQTIENDRSLQTPSWQLGSLRKTLKGIETQIKSVGASKLFAGRKLRTL